MVDKKEIIILIFVILVLLGVVLYLKNVEIESIGEKSDSERTISIISAEKLDKDYNFVEDIYEKVSKKDKNYALIDEGIVKVKFEREISNANDISFYAESEDGVKVSIYSEDEVLLSNINVKNYKLYQSFFKGLKRPSNTFYLKVNGTLKLDYIFDPLSLKVNISDISIDTHVLNITLENNFSHLTISNVTPYYGVGSISRVKELVIYYSFDVNHTNNITHDYTRWDNDGTVFLNGTGNWTKNCGMFGGCYNFDGDGDFINVTKSTTN